MIAAAVILYALGAFCAFMAVGFIVTAMRMGGSGGENAGANMWVGTVVGLFFGSTSAGFCVGASHVWGLA